MLLRPLILFIATFFSAQAFVLPNDLKDGVYSAETVKGLEVHKKLSNFPSTSELQVNQRSADAPKTPNPHIGRRDTSERIHCGCGHYMNPQNTDDAVAALKVQLDGAQGTFINAPFSFYIIRGSVVAFFCLRNRVLTYAYNGNFYGQELAVITQQCGAYVAGSRFKTFYANPYSGTRFTEVTYGYMNHYPGLDFCSAATGSAADHC